MNGVCSAADLKKFMDLDQLRASAKPQKVIFNDKEISKRYVEYLIDNSNAKGSRRDVIIQKHVKWLCTEIFPKNKNYFLDIGCGVGHYSYHLVNNGNIGVGIDIIDIAVSRARTMVDPTQCQFICADFLDYDFPRDLDVVIFTYSVFNHLSIEEGKCLLRKIYDSLSVGGVFYFEPLTFIPEGSLPAYYWEISKKSLFFPEPHLSLFENRWTSNGSNLTVYNYLLAASGKIASFYDNYHLYTVQEYEDILSECGFSKIRLCQVPYINLEEDKGYLSFVAYK